MRIFFVFLLFGLAIIRPAISEVNLNPPHGSDAYRAYSVFSPDATKMEHVRKDVIVVFHGFKSAVPNGTYKRIRTAFLKTHTVIGLNYNPLNVAKTLAFLDTVEKNWLNGRNVTVLGTSAGGYWANYFGHQIGAQKIVLLNPVIDPLRQLGKYIGRYKVNVRRKEKFLVTTKALAPYQGLTETKRKGLSRLVVLSADDKLLNYRDALSVFAGEKNTTVIVYSSGGHTLNLRAHQARAAIINFVIGN